MPFAAGTADVLLILEGTSSLDPYPYEVVHPYQAHQMGTCQDAGNAYRDRYAVVHLSYLNVVHLVFVHL